MFQEIINTIIDSKTIDEIVVVSKNNKILKQIDGDIIHIADKNENGVNHAIKLADEYVINNGFDASVIFPQDIPLIKASDIRYLLRVYNVKKAIFIVPSRRFDGTNALVRMPTNAIITHYDEDSYKIHLDVGKQYTTNTSLLLIKRIMFDIDNIYDLKLLLKQNEKHEMCNRIRRIMQ